MCMWDNFKTMIFQHTFDPRSGSNPLQESWVELWDWCWCPQQSQCQYEQSQQSHRSQSSPEDTGQMISEVWRTQSLRLSSLCKEAGMPSVDQIVWLRYQQGSVDFQQKLQHQPRNHNISIIVTDIKTLILGKYAYLGQRCISPWDAPELGTLRSTRWSLILWTHASLQMISLPRWPLIF